MRQLLAGFYLWQDYLAPATAPDLGIHDLFYQSLNGELESKWIDSYIKATQTWRRF